MKVGPGFCPEFLWSATSRTRCWLLPKGSKISAPAGANRKFSETAPTVVFLAIWYTYSTYRRKRHTRATLPSQTAPNKQCNNASDSHGHLPFLQPCRNLQCRKDKLQCCNLHLGICQNHFLLGFVVTISGMFFLA